MANQPRADSIEQAHPMSATDHTLTDAGGVEALDALTTLITDVYTSHPLDIARVILVSDWLAAHDAEVARTAAKEAEVRWMKVTVMRVGEAIRVAAERAWDEGWTYAFDDHGPMNGNPHRAARIAREEGRA